MIKKVKKKFKWLIGGQEDFVTPTKTIVEFSLKYKNLLIGILKLADGTWSFKYSNAFKNQDKIKPLLDFPNIDKEYTSEELYPFFLNRIPSPKQPKVQKAIEKKEITDANNQVELLTLFGRKSISNPFLLVTT